MKVALLSDVHANLVALTAVLGALPTVHELWVMGDTVGYGPDPSGTLAALRQRGAHIVSGNHDRAVATGAGLDVFNHAAAEAARLHRSWLSAEERDILAGLPETIERGRFSLCHGSFREPLWEYVITPVAAKSSLERAATPHGCCGHTHLPALFRMVEGRVEGLRPANDEPIALTERSLINPGSVGQPRDGDPRAAYALLELLPDGLAANVTFKRVAYDVAAVRDAIHARNLPEILGDRLEHGL